MEDQFNMGILQEESLFGGGAQSCLILSLFLFWASGTEQ